MLFRSYSDMTDGKAYLGAMFGSGTFADSASKYYFLSNVAIFVVAIIGSTNLPSLLAKKICSKNQTLAAVLNCLYVALVMLMSVACLVSDSYNPFLYFRF